jgi:UDP-galactopyranose mutase
MHKTVLIVGGGYAGCCVARVLKGLGHAVRIFEKETVPGGMARSYQIEGMTYEHGPHVLANHGCSERAMTFIKKYIPVRNTTMSAASFMQGTYLNFPPYAEDIKYLKQKDQIEKEIVLLNPRGIDETNFETYLISKVGKTLYTLFYKDFTEKFWQIEPRTLSASWAKIRRLGESLHTTELFFNSTWCAYPETNFNELFKNILDDIDITYGTPIKHVDCANTSVIDTAGKRYSGDAIISTLSIDELFDFRYGTLDYAGYDIEPVVIHREYYHPFDARTKRHYSMVYYPEKDVPQTRITEYKCFNNKARDEAYRAKTVITRETPTKKMKLYPITDQKNEALFGRYVEELTKHTALFSLGRQGLYKYTTLDTMTDQVFRFIEQAGSDLEAWERKSIPEKLKAFYAIRGT